MHSPIWRPFLFVMLITGFLIRLNGIFMLKHSLSHDESVSYLCASATQGKFETGLPEQVNEPSKAGDIQAYYAAPTKFEFGIVAKDLAKFDIHPPLYFWLLHAIQRMVGMDIRNGPLLNLLITCLLLALLYRTSVDLLGDRLHALACCTIWFLSPAVVVIDLEARHYQLLALLALAMFTLGRKLWSGEIRPLALLLFTFVNALGMLTHYYFGFLLLPGLAIMLVRFGVARSVWYYFASLVISLGVFLLLFPSFWEFLAIYLAKHNAGSAGSIHMMERLKALIASIGGFFGWWRAVWLLVIVLAAVAVVQWTRTRERIIREEVSEVPWQIALYLHLIWYLVFSAGLYLMGISPFHAVGGEYFGMIWPLLCIAVVHWSGIMLPSHWRKVIFAAFTVQLAVSCWFAVSHSPYVGDLVPASWYTRMNESEVVITNEGRRGYLPRMAMGLHANKPLWVLSGEGMQRFDATSNSNVSFWLYTPVLSAPPQPAVLRMLNAGFEEDLRSMGHHQLRAFTR